MNRSTPRCYACGTAMLRGSAVHASTATHRRRIAPRLGGAWNARDDRPRAWSRSLRDWDRQYDEDAADAVAAGWAPSAWPL